MYERMEPLKYPEPRDIRNQLERQIVNKYKDRPLSEITLATEVILKCIVPKDGSPERPLLKYKVINLCWEDVNTIKNINFNKKMFKWSKSEEVDYQVDVGGY
jgi:hypothetical protein